MSTPHLILAHDGPVPIDILEAFERAVAADGLTLQREARPAPRTAASMTLLAFMGVGLILTKAYFEDPPPAPGPAHAAVLDAALRELGQRLMAIGLRRAPAQPPVDATGRFSLLLSIWTDRDADSRFKMLIPADLSQDGVNAALSAYLAFAHAYHRGDLDPEDLEVLAGARPLAGVVLLAYDPASATLQPVDPFEGR